MVGDIRCRNCNAEAELVEVRGRITVSEWRQFRGEKIPGHGLMYVYEEDGEVWEDYADELEADNYDDIEFVGESEVDDRWFDSCDSWSCRACGYSSSELNKVFYVENEDTLEDEIRPESSPEQSGSLAQNINRGLVS